MAGLDTARRCRRMRHSVPCTSNWNGVHSGRLTSSSGNASLSQPPSNSFQMDATARAAAGPLATTSESEPDDEPIRTHCV
eukprot:4611301-Prymnesium_polylepis.1